MSNPSFDNKSEILYDTLTLESGIKTLTSKVAMQLTNGRVTFDFTFIDDPTWDKLAGVLTLKGTSITSNPNSWELTRNREEAFLNWPAEYVCDISLLPYNVDSSGSHEKARISQADPINVNDAVEYSSSVGYNLGGTIKYGPPEATVGMSWNQTYNYKHKNFKTALSTNTTHRVAWNTQFVSAYNQGDGPYTRDSDSTLWGNQLFMHKRVADTDGLGNLEPVDNISSIIAHSFNPEFSATILAERNAPLTPLTIAIYAKYDQYHLSKSLGTWKGENYKYDHDNRTKTLKQDCYQWTIDWQQRKILEK